MMMVSHRRTASGERMERRFTTEGTKGTEKIKKLFVSSVPFVPSVVSRISL